MEMNHPAQEDTMTRNAELNDLLSRDMLSITDFRRIGRLARLTGRMAEVNKLYEPSI